MKRLLLFTSLVLATVINLHAQWYIAGNGSAATGWCGGQNWNASGCPMTAGSYSVSVPAGTYEFKITDGTWVDTYGFSSVDASASTPGYEGSDNVKFTVSTGANINITFDGMYIVITSDVPFGGTAVTSWTIVGGTELTGANWDPAAAANDLTLVGGTYQLVKYVNLDEGSYDYKAVANHAYSIKEVPSSGNQTLTIDADGDYEVTFTLNSAGTILSAVAELDTKTDSYLTLNVNDASMGTVSGAGLFMRNINVTATATPNPGYKFVNWTGSKTSTDNPFTFKIGRDDVVLQANFEADIPSLTSIEIVDYSGEYDGQDHKVTVNGTVDGDVISFSTDSATWGTHPALKNVGETAVFVRIQRSGYLDWGGKATVTITPKQLWATGTSVAEKVYDGTTSATVTPGTLQGVVGTDDVILSATADFDDRNAGEDKNVTVLFSIEGAAAGNYQKPADGNFTATITRRQLTAAGTTVADKEYDGATGATVTPGTLQGVVGSDNVILSATADFDDRNAGEDKNVTVLFSIEGADAGNYLKPADANLMADITPKQLTAAGVMADDKVYDGTTGTTVVVGALQGVVGSDDVSSSATGTFADSNAGKDKDVTVSFTLTGADQHNYFIEDDMSYATVNKREITLESQDLTKKYDGMPLSGSGSSISCVYGSYVAGECLTCSLTGSQTSIGSSPNIFDIDSNDSTNVNNYNVTSIWGTLTVIPTDELITITAKSSAKVYDGLPLADSGYTVSGALGAGDYVTNVNVQGSITAVGSADNVVTGYAIYSSSGEDVTSFYTNIQTVNGKLTVTNPVSASIKGMYDKWNIVLNVSQLMEDLAVFEVTAAILPENVRWYIVGGDAQDEIDMTTGLPKSDDTAATPATGLFHTEDREMTDAYYAVVEVPEAESALGVKYFVSNVLFMDAPQAPTRSNNAVKVVIDGQIMIETGSGMYNTQGIRQ